MASVSCNLTDINFLLLTVWRDYFTRFDWIRQHALVGPALAELTPQDLEAIRKIVKEEITESEKRTDLKFEKMNERFNTVNVRIDGLEKRLNFIGNVFLIFIIGIPVGFIVYAVKRRLRG
jgi:hypothetical protein